MGWKLDLNDHFQDNFYVIKLIKLIIKDKEKDHLFSKVTLGRFHWIGLNDKDQDNYHILINQGKRLDLVNLFSKVTLQWVEDHIGTTSMTEESIHKRALGCFTKI